MRIRDTLRLVVNAVGKLTGGVAFIATAVPNICGEANSTDILCYGLVFFFLGLCAGLGVKFASFIL